MREKQQKRAALANTSNKSDEKPSTTTASKQRQMTAPANSSANVLKTKQASPKKYKFTPIVFDLVSDTNKKVNDGSTAEQTKRNSLDRVVSPGSASVQLTGQLSVSKADASATDGSVAGADISVTIQQSVPSKSADLTTEVTDTVTDTPSGKSEPRTTPVIKRQSSCSNPPSDVTKKRRTSIDTRLLVHFCNSQNCCEIA